MYRKMNRYMYTDINYKDKHTVILSNTICEMVT